MSDVPCKSKAVGSRWVGVLVALALVAAGVTVQWGVLLAKLDGVETALSEIRVDYRSIERRLSFLEGRLSGAGPGSGGGSP